LLLVLALGLVIQPFVGAAAALVLGVVRSSGARERTALFALALLLALYGTAFSFIRSGSVGARRPGAGGRNAKDKSGYRVRIFALALSRGRVAVRRPLGGRRTGWGAALSAGGERRGYPEQVQVRRALDERTPSPTSAPLLV
jgi:hypothetical protein